MTRVEIVVVGFGPIAAAGVVATGLVEPEVTAVDGGGATTGTTGPEPDGAGSDIMGPDGTAVENEYPPPVGATNPVLDG